MKFPVGLCMAGLACNVLANSPAPLKTETFDRDPQWEGFNNHVAPKRVPTVVQDFGFSGTHVAGKEQGEIGGKIWRSSTRASYAANIAPKTLNDKLTASGTFAITATSGSSGVFFGWFNSTNTGNNRRDTLGFRFAGQGPGARITLQLVTDKNAACGTKVTPWVVDKTKLKGQGRKFRPPSIKNDGTHYRWTLRYDPEANNGEGQFECTVRSDSTNHEEFEQKTFTVPLRPGYKTHGTTFDRFGLMNGERGGNSMTIYFDDLVLNGTTESFSQDPGWVGVGNHVSFEDKHQGGTHDFGYSAQTKHAGSGPGEIGGMMWRSGIYGYYADRIGHLSLTNRLEARGKVVLVAAPPDSGMNLGWFNSREKENAPTQAGNFVGVKIGGPTRVGHYFLPAYATAQTDVKANPNRDTPKRINVEPNSGPVLAPEKVFDWKLIYDPLANDGKGAIEATLGKESVTLPLKPGDKERGATFDRFGLFTTHIGGSYVKIYFDDISYTTGVKDQ